MSYVKVELSRLTVALIKKIVCSHHRPNHYPPQFTLGQVPAARATYPCHPHHPYPTTHQYHPSQEVQVSTTGSLFRSVMICKSMLYRSLAGIA
jgi:hypothetical protein